MQKKLLPALKKLYYRDIKLLPSEYRKDFFEEITKINYRRTKFMCFAFVFIIMILILFDLLLLRTNITASRLLLYHVSFLLVSIFFSAFFFYVYPKLNIKVKRFVLFLFIIIIFIYCELLSFNMLIFDKHITPIVICFLSISFFFILNLVDRILLFVFVYISFFFLMHNNFNLPFSIETFINSSLIFLFCFFLSRFNFQFFLEQYSSKRIILNNIKEIGHMNADLENKIKERTQELTQAQTQIEFEKLKNSLFTNLSHEFRTPINVILSAQQLLAIKLKKMVSEENYQNLEKNLLPIKQHSYRLMRLSSNIIDIAKIDAGYYSLNLKNTDIVHVIEEVVMSVASITESRQISIIFDTQTEERIIAIDVEKIERAVLNLLSNAVKFTPKNGLIQVNLYENTDKFIISVRDNGIGIPDSMKDAIFNRFVQVDKTLTRDHEGSGLGLSIVKSIVELHNGSISLNSDLYSGSEFIISLPIHILEEDSEISIYKSKGQDKLDLLEIEFSDIE